MSLRNIPVIPGLPFSVKPFIDITDQLPSKPDWEPIRTPEQITHVSVHHSAVEGATIQSYANYHVNNQGWAHIGYHAVVKGDQVYQTNDLLTFSYHTSSNNPYTVSVSVSGNLSERSITEPERQCLYAAILTLIERFKIPVENVWGHREFPDNNTSCPGSLNMDQLRYDIRGILKKMEYTQTDGNKKAVSFEIANQILYLYNLAQGKTPEGNAANPGDVIWAQDMLLELRPFMKDKGFL